MKINFYKNKLTVLILLMKVNHFMSINVLQPLWAVWKIRTLNNALRKLETFNKFVSLKWGHHYVEEPQRNEENSGSPFRKLGSAQLCVSKETETPSNYEEGQAYDCTNRVQSDTECQRIRFYFKRLILKSINY